MKALTTIKDYTARIDNKKRITIRGASFQYYYVREYENGCILLEPRELTAPGGVSANALEEMDRMVYKYNSGEGIGG